MEEFTADPNRCSRNSLIINSQTVLVLYKIIPIESHKDHLQELFLIQLLCFFTEFWHQNQIRQVVLSIVKNLYHPVTNYILFYRQYLNFDNSQFFFSIGNVVPDSPSQINHGFFVNKLLLKCISKPFERKGGGAENVAA